MAAPPGSVIRLWNGATTTLHIGDGEETTLLMPPDDPSDISAGNSGAAVSTRGGDGLVGGVRGDAFLTPAPGRPG
ncbi:hypothetical protein OHS70_16555 [Streptomyces sp. NBC_00390]|uniref:hypothetical protein n=1 Tax=Streptomyces sp. NBC_00390 TaxID=2975736 RepID=UPI002E1A3645